jgi:hypothetical protein
MVELPEVRALAAEAFGSWTRVRVDEDRARRTVPHEPTRRMLTEVGLPVQTNLFDLSPEFSTGPLDMVEFQKRARFPVTFTPEFVASRGHYLDLGFIPDNGAYLDPVTGKVYGFVGWDLPYLLNSGLAEFLYFHAYIEKHRRVDGVPLDDFDTDTGYEAAARIIAHLATIDAAAVQGEDSAWEGWLDDGFSIGLFTDWNWSQASVDHFLRLGVDPTALEPRRPLARRVANPWADASGAGGPACSRTSGTPSVFRSAPQ